MISSNYSTMNDALLRKIEGKVGLYNGSTLLDTFLPTDKLQEITIARVGEKGKFFGFGVCQQATVKIIDKANDLVFLKGENLKTSFRANSGSAYARVCPSFYIKDAVRDEKTSVYTITAYDALDSAVGHVFSELGMEAPYTLINVIDAVKSILGLSGISYPTGFDISYENGANLSGDETLRAILNAVAEVTQTIYYVDQRDYLVFKRLDKTGDPVLTISKNDYFELTTALPVTLSKIMSVTELGDNVDAGDDTGVCQYVRDNPFWNARTDLQTLLPTAVDRISGLTIVPYNLKWRGNFLTELCDKIKVEDKYGNLVTTYILDDSFTYKGGFSQTSDWEYKPDSERATSSNPLTVGEKINQTFARVDKVNRTVTLHASEIAEAKSNISELQVNTQGITSSVSTIVNTQTDLSDTIVEIQNGITEQNESNAKQFETLTQKVEATMTSTDVQLAISTELENGVDKVTTSTGFTFNDKGLTINKSDSEMRTNIDEDGMSIFKGSQEVLTANNTGVDAQNLHATTYLIIGTNSRFEDYGSDRTGCFWIG